MGVISLSEQDTRPFVVNTVILTADRPTGTVQLKRGEEMFVVAEGQPVLRPGYTGPDNIWCDGADIGHGRWPVVLCRVQTRFIHQWANLGSDVANRIVLRARRRLNATAALSPTPDRAGGEK